MDRRETRWDGMDRIDMAQDRDQWRALVNTVLNLRGSIKCWEVLEWLHSWRLLKKGSDFVFSGISVNRLVKRNCGFL
jgi:hypothetical protein